MTLINKIATFQSQNLVFANEVEKVSVLELLLDFYYPTFLIYLLQKPVKIRVFLGGNFTMYFEDILGIFSKFFSLNHQLTNQN